MATEWAVRYEICCSFLIATLVWHTPPTPAPLPLAATRLWHRLFFAVPAPRALGPTMGVSVH
ncbi:MAG: hypothetical protein NZ703_14145, partial [Gemmataceae bacterium]|nr:hypothetical protein [Gemmataceae bacterium]